MNYVFGDVVYAEAQYTSLSKSKNRPLVVIHSEKYQNARGDVIVAPITSRIKLKKELKEFEIKNIKSAGLPKEFAVKAVLLTLEEKLIKDKIGKFHNSDQTSLRRMLKQIIG